MKKTVLIILLLFCLTVSGKAQSVESTQNHTIGKNLSSASDDRFDDRIDIDDLMDDILGEDPSKVMVKKDEDQEVKPRTGDHRLEFGVIIGLKENVVEDYAESLDSQYIQSDAEYIYHLSGGSIRSSAVYFEVDKRRYTDIDTEGDNQGGAFGVWIDYSLPFTINHRIRLEYHYQETLDENNYIEDEPVPITYYHEYVGFTGFDISLSDSYFLACSVELTRYRAEEEMDTYYFGKAKLALAKTYTHGSEIEFEGGITKTHYDYDRDEETNEIFEIETRYVSIENNHFWSEKDGLSVDTFFKYTEKRDNRFGNSNYDLYELWETIRYESESWSISGDFMLANYQYLEVLADYDSDSEAKLDNWEVETGIELTIYWETNVRLIFEITKTNYRSNNRLDEYEVNYYQASAEYQF